MKSIWMLLAAVLISLAWLLPHHYRPWVTYSGEALAFAALFTLCLIFVKSKLQIPKITLPILLLSLVPMLQLLTGQAFFLSKAFLASCYVFAFWLSIVVAYNLSLNAAREQLMQRFSLLLLGTGVASAIIALCQWLTIEQYFPGLMANLRSGRPYANFAQPNNMATFLILALLAALYLYETKTLKLKVLVPSAVLLIFAVALSQSRTSWVALGCILIYMAYQQYRGYVSIKWYAVVGWVAAFVASLVFIPHLAGLFAEALDAPIKSVDLARRATGDMSRIAIWNQMVHAIMQQPLWGYGWHQTSVAYTLVSDTVQGPVWVKSAHNFVLDFILWNGLVIAMPFLVYFSYWAWQLHKHINGIVSVVCILMIGAITVHALLEFPLFYSYFLLPFGFLMGILQAQNKDTAVWEISAHCMQLAVLLGGVLMVMIHRDYLVAGPKLAQSSKYEKQPEKWTLNKPIYLLTEFNDRIEWIRLNPHDPVTKAQLDKIEHMVLNYPIPYDLIKYARVLAYNGYEAEAKYQLKRLEILRDVKVSYESLFMQPNASSK
jgi:hypothetical protein